MFHSNKIVHIDELTRDYAYNVKDEKLRKCKLLPWIEEYMDEIIEEETTDQQEPDIEYFKVFIIA